MRAGHCFGSLLSFQCRYASDVTRTWPVNGTFSARQREVYEIVLDTHRYSDDKRCPTNC